MKIQVLGTGCSSCHQLLQLTKQAAKELNLKEEVEYIDDIQRILAMGVMQVPALAVNGKAVLTGLVTDIEKIKKAIIGDAIHSGGESAKGCSCGGNC